MWECQRLPPCTVRQALTIYLDITTPPNPALLAQMCRLAPDDEDLKKLQALVDVCMQDFIDIWLVHRLVS